MFHPLSIGPNGEVYKPTILPTPGFDPSKDAEAIEAAIKGFGTNEKALTEIIGRRTSNERQEITKKYKSLYGKDLKERLKSELSGDYEELVLACIKSPAKHLAYCCYKAIAGAGTDEETLTQILACSTNQEIREIKEEYQKVLIEKGCDPNKRNLEKDIKDDCGGHYGRVLIALVQADRDEPSEAQMAQIKTQGITAIIDQAKAKQQAEELYNSGESKLGTDESAFIRILVSSSVWQVAAIDLAYGDITSKTLVQAIEEEMSGNLAKVMKTIVEACLNRPATFAKLLNKSMKGLGTDDLTLIRIISSRADIDMETIKQQYLEMYGKSLASDIKGDTSGHYQKLLLTLIDEN